MKTRIILFAGSACLALFLFSFKSLSRSGGNTGKTIMLSVLNGKSDDSGFMLTYGDGKIEKIPITSKLKVMDPTTWVGVQAQTTIILNDLRDKGYRFVGNASTVYGTQVMVLEKD